jgi:hypothetical protein
MTIAEFARQAGHRPVVRHGSADSELAALPDQIAWAGDDS